MISIFAKSAVFYQIGFQLLYMLFVGFFTLDVHFANSVTIFIALISSFLIGFFIRQKIQWTNTMRLFFISSSGLLLYVLMAFITDVNNWYIGPCACLVAHSVGFAVASGNATIFYSTPLIVLLSVYYAFFWFPEKDFIVNKMQNEGQHIYIRNDTLINFLDVSGYNQWGAAESKIVFIETWNEHCGACFQAMRDLHPFLKEQEQQHKNFTHIYLYVPLERRKEQLYDMDKVFRNKRLPYNDMDVLYDKDSYFYNTYLNGGFPHFVLIDTNQEIIFSLNGYSANFANTYKRYFRKSFKKQSMR